MKKIKNEVVVKYEYFTGNSRAEDGYFEGGVVIPKFKSLKVWVDDLEEFDDTSDTFVVKGKQINIAGDAKELYEFGKLFIAMSRYNSDDPDYHEHLDELKKVGDKDYCEMIIRKE